MIGVGLQYKNRATELTCPEVTNLAMLGIILRFCRSRNPV